MAINSITAFDHRNVPFLVSTSGDILVIHPLNGPGIVGTPRILLPKKFLQNAEMVNVTQDIFRMEWILRCSFENGHEVSLKLDNLGTPKPEDLIEFQALCAMVYDL